MFQTVSVKLKEVSFFFYSFCSITDARAKNVPKWSNSVEKEKYIYICKGNPLFIVYLLRIVEREF